MTCTWDETGARRRAEKTRLGGKTTIAQWRNRGGLKWVFGAVSIE